MADFCAACTRDGMPGNDLDGWLDGAPGTRWALCEGCGWHRFDNAGEPACTSAGQPELDAACPQCLAHGMDNQGTRQRLAIAQANSPAGINTQDFPLGDVSRLIAAAERLVRAVRDTSAGPQLRDLCAAVDATVAALTDETGATS